MQHSTPSQRPMPKQEYPGVSNGAMSNGVDSKGIPADQPRKPLYGELEVPDSRSNVPNGEPQVIANSNGKQVHNSMPLPKSPLRNGEFDNVKRIQQHADARSPSLPQSQPQVAQESQPQPQGQTPKTSLRVPRSRDSFAEHPQVTTAASTQQVTRLPKVTNIPTYENPHFRRAKKGRPPTRNKAPSTHPIVPIAPARPGEGSPLSEQQRSNYQSPVSPTRSAPTAHTKKRSFAEMENNSPSSTTPTSANRPPLPAPAATFSPRLPSSHRPEKRLWPLNITGINQGLVDAGNTPAQRDENNGPVLFSNTLYSPMNPRGVQGISTQNPQMGIQQGVMRDSTVTISPTTTTTTGGLASGQGQGWSRNVGIGNAVPIAAGGRPLHSAPLPPVPVQSASAQ